MQSILFVGADFEQYLRLKAILNNLVCIYSVSLPDGIRQFNQQQFSLLILDLSLIASDSGQEELLRSFRRAHPVPIIADIFNRLKYMDRRGSGFKKILDSYEFQEHYTEEMKPEFKSSNSEFWLIFKETLIKVFP